MLKRHQAIGLLIILLFSLGWAVRTCSRYTGEAHVLARQVKAAGLPVTEIRGEPTDSGYQQAAVEGEGFKLMIMHFGSRAVWSRFAKGMAAGAGSAKDGRTVAVWTREPDLVLGWIDPDKPALLADLDRALAGFARSGGPAGD